MSQGKDFELGAFAGQVEMAADRHEVLGAEVDAMPNVWALKGKPAVTSLLAEATLAIIGRYSVNANDAISAIDAAVELSQLYDTARYKEIADRGRLKANVSVDALIVDLKFRTYFAEHGLGLLRYKANYIYNIGRNQSSIKRERKTAEGIMTKMRLNGSIDPHISDGLSDIYKSGEFSAEDYFKGVLELARRTSRAVETNQAAAKKQKSWLAVGRRALRKKL